MPQAVKALLEGVGRLAAINDERDVEQSLADLLRRTVRTSWTAIYPFDRARRAFSSATCCGLPPRQEELFSHPPFLAEKLPQALQLMRRKKHLILHGDALDLLHPAYVPLAKRMTLVALPMIVQDDVLGLALAARGLRQAPFSPDDIAVMTAIVSHASLVLRHLKTFDESLELAVAMAQRVDMILALDDINKAISSTLNRKKIIGTAIQHLERMTQCDVVVLLQESRRELVVTDTFTALRYDIVPPATRVPLGDTCIGRVFAEGNPCVIPDLAAEPPDSFITKLVRGGMKALLGIPLSGQGRVKGVLVLADAKPGKFAESEAFTAEKIGAQLAVALENARLYEDLQKLFISTVASLSNAIDAKSPWTKGHSMRVMHTSGRIARELGLPDDAVEAVRIGGLLHDVGKIGIIEAVLEKPDSLSMKETPAMRLHPEKGVAILSPIEQFRDILPAIKHHHERWDGKGYPDGLTGEAIPLPARIVSVADAFDAMIAVRPYKKGRTVAAAVQELVACAGSQFDPKVVQAFVSYLQRQTPVDLLSESEAPS